MNQNSTWKDWFVFSKRERYVVTAILFFLLVYAFAFSFSTTTAEKPAIQNLDHVLAALPAQKDSALMSTSGNTPVFASASVRAGEGNAVVTAVLYSFDPNTLDAAGFNRLGLSARNVTTILHYREKGGHFRQPEDLKKIYGLSPADADRLIPFVQIRGNDAKVAAAGDYGFAKNDNKKDKAISYVIEINTATVDDWKRLPAIGDVLSNRIVKYRTRLGGFTDVDDLKKVYGLSDSAFAEILPHLSDNIKKAEAGKPDTPKQVDINTATANELTTNANISADIAEAIVLYRRQHGRYTSVAGIKNIVFINDDTYRTVAPFLIVE